MQSIFTKIISGDIFSYKVYENETTFAFLDINPINPGHVLVVPKIEIDQIWDIPEPFYSDIFKTSKLISSAIAKATGCKRVCAWAEGFSVPHAHFHVCPFYNEAGEFWVKAPTSQAEKEFIDMQQKIINKLI